LEQLEEFSREDLIQIIVELRRVNQRLQAEIEELKQRGGAAPFSKGKHQPDPKPPGRKPGQGFFRFRGAPKATETGEAIAVPVSEACCPECGGELGRAHREMVSTTDMPAQPEPEVRCYAVEVRHCRRCGSKVRGRHPDIARDQHGATAHRVGPRVKALAHILHYVHGVPVRRTPVIVENLTGVRLTQGALTQNALKQADGGAVAERYQNLRASVREQAVVHTDDTGWRIGGEGAFLMAFVNAALSVYQVRPRHRNEEVRELIPADFAGVMVCDRGRSYDAGELESVTQQKCLAHLIRNAAKVAAEKTGRARHFPRQLTDLLRRALLLSAHCADIRLKDYCSQAEALNDELTHLLRNRKLRDRDNQRLLNGAGAQQDRGRLLRFLSEDGVEPTNNRAERDLRPAVIARKVSHCSKNENGARAFEAFTSVLQTMRKTNPAALVSSLTALISPQPASG
jgi:ribosomal protein S15P/S13E